QISTVDLFPDPETKEEKAMIIADIDPKVSIPQSAKISVFLPTGVGNASLLISFKDSTGPMVSKDGKAVLRAEPADTGLIPQSAITDIHNVSEEFLKMHLPELTKRLTELTQNLTVVSTDLHSMLTYASPEDVAGGAKANISTVIVR